MVGDISWVAMYDADSCEVVRDSDVDLIKMHRADVERTRESKLVQSGSGFHGVGGQGDIVR